MSEGPGELLRQLLTSYGEGDLDALRALLADDLVAYVTNAEGGADRVEGAGRYVDRLPDLRAAGGSITVTQVLDVDPHLGLAMVEIEAARGDDRLHNFASFLARTAGGKVVALWMVEALPAHSDEFWS